MITTQRDWKLQQLGIVEWIPRHPVKFYSRISSTFIPMHIHLLIISKDPLKLDDSIVVDILRTLHLKKYQVLQLIPDKFVVVPKDFHCNIWQIGMSDKIILDSCLDVGYIISPSLNELIENPNARRALWRQICQYEHYFFSVV